MGSWSRHIDRFELQYEKTFARDTIFGADLIDRIHKLVQVFLQSCNMTAIKEVELGALAEFGDSRSRWREGKGSGHHRRRRDVGNWTGTYLEQGKVAGEVDATQSSTTVSTHSCR